LPPDFANFENRFDVVKKRPALLYANLSVRLAHDCIFEDLQSWGVNIMATKPDSDAPPMNFQSIRQLDVPKGRDGKHKQIVTQLLSDIQQLVPGSALKIPLSALPDTKENIRSALNRATHHRGMEVSTSSDAEFLYVWVVEPEP
jgi:hypothetical protein